MAQNAEFGERSSIGSAQVQIRDDGGSATSAAAIMVRKAAADMQGLVRTQNILDNGIGKSLGGYEGASAYMAATAANKTLGAIMGDLGEGQADVVPVTDRKGKVVGARIQVSKQAEAGAVIAGTNEAAKSEIAVNTATSEDTRRKTLNKMVNQAALDPDVGGMDNAKQLMIQSGYASGLDKDGKLLLSSQGNWMHVSAVGSAGAAQAGMHGFALANGSSAKVRYGYDTSGKASVREEKHDSQEDVNTGDTVNFNATGQISHLGAKEIGAKALEYGVLTATALTLGATANKLTGYVLPKSTTIGKDGTEKAVRTTAMEWTGKGFGKAADYVSDRFGLAKKSPIDTTTKSSEKPPHSGGDNEGDKAQKSSFDQNTPPEQIGSSPSSSNNSTTNQATPQGKLESLKNTSPLATAKDTLKNMARSKIV